VDLAVTPLNGSFAASLLGIHKNVPNPGATLTGDDLDPAGHLVNSIFNSLGLLRDALAGDSDLLEFMGAPLDNVQDQIIDARADIGGRVQRLELSRNFLEEQKLLFQGLMADDREVDIAEAVLEFEKQSQLLEAAYAVTASVLSLNLLDFLT
jgi:flagellar hook-associated protein 3 FlgL